MNKIIPLKVPVRWHDKLLTEIVMKEPTAWHLFEFGDLQSYSRDQNGMLYSIPNDVVIVKYLDRLLDVDGGASILTSLTLDDGLAIREALFHFFTAATSARAP